jgi:hypothetical protein
MIASIIWIGLGSRWAWYRANTWKIASVFNFLLATAGIRTNHDDTTCTDNLNIVQTHTNTKMQFETYFHNRRYRLITGNAAVK